MSLSIRNLSFSYGKTAVLHRVSFSVNNGEFLAILGPNGVGKTTLFKCILGLQNGYAGSVECDGSNLKTLNSRAIAHRIALIPQVHPMSFRYRVFDMVLMGTSHRLSPLASPGRAERALAEAALKRLDILSLAEKSFDCLSGGEQQLVFVARALAQQARILLMDEPTSSLDYGNQLRVLSMVRSLTQDGYTVLLSTHNPQHALWYADYALALKDGAVHAFGAVQDVVTPQLIETLYGRETILLSTEQGAVLVPTQEERNADLE